MSAPERKTYDPSQVVASGPNSTLVAGFIEGAFNYGDDEPAKMTDRSGRVLPESFEVTLKPHSRKGTSRYRWVCEQLERGPNTARGRRVLKRIRKRLQRRGEDRFWEYKATFGGAFNGPVVWPTETADDVAAVAADEDGAVSEEP